MADPTQQTRDFLAKAAQKVLPSSSPLGVSLAENEKMKNLDLSNQEFQNYVQQDRPIEPIQIPEEPSRLPATQVDESQLVKNPAFEAPEAVAPVQAQPVESQDPTQALQDEYTRKMLSADGYQKEIEAQQARIKSTQEEYNKRVQQWDKSQEDVKNFKFDDKSMWEKSSTGQKIALLIGGLLSAQSPEGAKAFMGNIQSAMDRDLQLQKEKYNSLKEKGQGLQTHIGRLSQQLGSDDAALLSLRGQQLNLMKSKLDAIAQNAQSRIMRDNAQRAKLVAESEIVKNQAEAQKILREQATDIKNINLGPYKGRIGNDQAANKFRTQYVAAENLQDTLGQIDKLAKEGVKLSPQKRGEVKTLLTVAVNQAKEALDIGKLSDFETEDLMDAIGDPRAWNSTYAGTKGKLTTIKQQVAKAVQNQAKSLGLYKEIGRPE